MDATMFIYYGEYEVEVNITKPDKEKQQVGLRSISITTNKGQLHLHFDSLKTMQDMLNLVLLRIENYLTDAE